MKKKKYTIFTFILFLTPLMVLNASAGECISCGGGALENVPAGVASFTRNLINDLKLLVPIALIGYGMYDFVKAIISGDEKVNKESQAAFIRRCIAAVLIFFVVALTQMVFALIPGKTKYAGCIPCFISDEGSCAGPYTCTSHRNNTTAASSIKNGVECNAAGFYWQETGPSSGVCLDTSPNTGEPSNSGSNRCKGVGERECYNIKGCRWSSTNGCVPDNSSGSSSSSSSSNNSTASSSGTCRNIKSERECYNAGCKWSNNTCISNGSSSSTTKSCNSYGISECGSSTSSQCEWDSNKNMCVAKGTSSSNSSPTVVTCSMYSTNASQCNNTPGCTYDSNAKKCVSGSSNSSNSSSGSIACSIYSTNASQCNNTPGCTYDSNAKKCVSGSSSSSNSSSAPTALCSVYSTNASQCNNTPGCTYDSNAKKCVSK